MNWTETVTSGTTTCATENDNPGTSSVRITVDLTKCPATAPNGTTPSVYTVDISFTDPNYGQTGDYRYTVQRHSADMSAQTERTQSEET